MKDLISVIVPVYNAEKYLDRCLRSLVDQSYENLEILLVNDGSTDRSAAICKAWGEKDARIKVLYQENQGVSAARNYGLDCAAGAYISFVDADDWIKPEMLEKQWNILQKEQSDIVLSGFESVTEKKQNIQNIQNVLKTLDISACCENSAVKYTIVDTKSYAGSYLLCGNNRCWSVMFKREAIGGVRFVKGLTIGEDLLFMMDILPQIEKATILQDQDYCYFINESGAMLADFRECYLDQILCWELAEERMRKLWPEYLPLIHVCLFQAALLVAGKLAQVSNLKSDRMKKYLARCSVAAKKSWNALGRERWKRLSKGYLIKGYIFLAMPKLYLRLYHIWKQ